MSEKFEISDAVCGAIRLVLFELAAGHVCKPVGLALYVVDERGRYLGGEHPFAPDLQQFCGHVGFSGGESCDP